MPVKKSFSDLINNEPIPVLVDFHAEWCGPCHMLSPVLAELAQEMSGKIKVIKVDIDKNQAVAMKYNVRSVPTMIVFKNGQILWRESGALPKAQIKIALQNLI